LFEKLNEAGKKTRGGGTNFWGPVKKVVRMYELKKPQKGKQTVRRLIGPGNS